MVYSRPPFFRIPSVKSRGWLLNHFSYFHSHGHSHSNKGSSFDQEPPSYGATNGTEVSRLNTLAKKEKKGPKFVLRDIFLKRGLKKGIIESINDNERTS